MKMKTSVTCSALIATMALTAADTPEVTTVAMSQAAFGRLVTVKYTLDLNGAAGAVVTFDVETNCTVNGEAKWASIGGEAVCNATGDVWRKVTESDTDNDGRYTISWRPDLAWEGHKVSMEDGGARAVVTAWALDNTPDYMVVDISEGAKKNTQKYYPAVEFLPGSALGQTGAITNNTDYRMSSIVMRKIMAKDVAWTMGSVGETGREEKEATHKVTLTNNYYIGVFPVTQCQWALIQKARRWPSYFNVERDMRPVENLAYNEIRLIDGTGVTGNSVKDVAVDLDKYSWPEDPHPDSFLGLLRSKTGIDFDLPSEAEWEFACRAGNGEGKWGDGSPISGNPNDECLNLLSRNQYSGGKIGGDTTAEGSCGVENGTAIVGTYRPNSWGLYDFHGNVLEFCLDWYEKDISKNSGMVNIDISNPALTLSGATAQESRRVRRGGNYNVHAHNCRSAYRDSDASTRRRETNGFRLVCRAGLE